MLRKGLIGEKELLPQLYEQLPFSAFSATFCLNSGMVQVWVTA